MAVMAALTTTDGSTLHLHHWPVASTARGTVLIVHGLGEHGGRYAQVAQDLNRAAWNVHAYDLRGHGRSSGARGALPDAQAHYRDLAQVLDALAPASGPRVLLGHSMGGLIAARFVAESLAPEAAAWSRAVDALVLSSPALDPGMKAAQKLLLGLLGPLAPNLALGNGLKPEWVSRDAAIVRAYVADPLVHDRVTARLVQLIVDGGQTVQALASRWRVPTLLMWAGADRCVAPRGSEAFAAAAPSSMVSAREWPGLFHEILNEPERDQVLAHLVQWLDATFVPTGEPT